MPRIAVALGVVTTIAVCIAINTYRYPMVREMVATAPQLRLPSGPIETEPKTPEPQAAAAPSRSAPAAAMASAGRASSDPKPSWRSEETEPAASTATAKKAVAKSKPPKAPAPKGERAGGKDQASGKSSPGMEEDLPGAGPTGSDQVGNPAAGRKMPKRKPKEPDPAAVAESSHANDEVPRSRRADDASSEDDDHQRLAETPSVVEPESKYGSLAESRVRVGAPSRERRPLTPLAAVDDQTQVKLPGEPLPDWNTAEAPKEQVERLPPVDQVWGAAAQLGPAAGDRIAIYPETGM